MMMDGMGLVMVICGLLGIALVLLAVAAAVWIVRRLKDSSGGRMNDESPEDILKRRYAAGELDDKEYADRRAGLGG